MKRVRYCPIHKIEAVFTLKTPKRKYWYCPRGSTLCPNLKNQKPWLWRPPIPEMTYGLQKWQARDRAVELRDKMYSLGWSIRLWENCGWHYEIRKGRVFVSGDEASSLNQREYSVQLGMTHNDIGTLAEWSMEGRFKDPNIAVRAQYRKMQRVLKYTNAATEDAFNAMRVVK